MEILDVTSAVVNMEEAILALFDNRYNSIMIIKPIIDEQGNPHLEVIEPDGVERLYWMEKFGMITEAEFQDEVGRLASKNERQKLYKLLKKELDQ